MKEQRALERLRYSPSLAGGIVGGGSVVGASVGA